MKKLHLISSLATSVLLFSASTAKAELLAYEPFDYPNGTRASALLANAGTGFVDEDLDPSGDVVKGGFEAANQWLSVMSEGSLSYGDLTTSHNKFRSSAGGTPAIMRIDVSGDSPLAAYIDSTGSKIGKEGETLYMSYLMQKQNMASGTDRALTSFVSDNGSTQGNISTTAENLAIGQGWGTNEFAAFSPSTTIAPVDNNVHLIVVKFEWVAGADDVATIYWDPNIELAEDAAENQDAGTRFQITQAIMNFDTLNFNAQNPNVPDTTNGGMMIDEIRFATSWEDALPLAQFYSVDVTQPDSGLISLDPEPEDDRYQEGQSVTISVEANSGYRFVELDINGNTYTEQPQTINITEDTTISATVEAIPLYDLTVNIDPSEDAGSVELDTDPFEEDGNVYTYQDGTTVILTATANEGYVFSGWTGAVDSEDTAIAVDITEDLELTAVFESEGGDCLDVSPWDGLTVGSDGFFKNSRDLTSPGIGYIYDEFYPWIFSYGFEGGEWFYLFPCLSTDETAFWGYNVDGGYYFWANSAWGYYYHFSDGAWVRFAGAESE